MPVPDRLLQTAWPYTDSGAWSYQNGVPDAPARQYSPLVPVFPATAFGLVADGSTDDTAAVLSALNYASSQPTGGLVALPEGRIRLTSTLTVNADGVGLIGSGFGTQLAVDAGWSAATPLIWYKQTPNTFRRGVRLENFSIDGQSVSALSTVIQLDGVRHADVNHIEVHHCPGTNLFMNGQSSGGYYGAYNTIRGCTFRDSYNGVGVLFTNSEWCSLIGNQFVLFNLAGSIAVHNLGGLNCNFVGNQFDAVDTAVYLDFSNYCTVAANQFDEGNTQYIKIKAGQANAITGNTFNQRTGSGTNIITVDLFGSNNAANLVTGNVAQSGRGWTNFVQEINTGGSPTGAGNTYANNNTGGYGVSLITGAARNNPPYNPVGHAVTQPAVPLSGTPQTNTTGVDCDVFVTGGTVTAISIGGTATGLTSGSFKVAAGQSITLTYSATPSWQWFGE